MKERPLHYLKQGGKLLAKTTIIVAMAFALSLLLMQPFTMSTAMLIDSDDTDDFTINDFYNRIANSRAVRALDQDIVIVDIEDFDRDGIAQLVDIVNMCNPAVVGIDVTFSEPRDNDSILLAALSGITHPVYAMTVKNLPAARDTFTIGERSFFFNGNVSDTEGVVNLPTLSAKGKVRDFPMMMTCVDTVTGKTFDVTSFAVALATAYRPEIKETIAKRANTEVINYPSREFRRFTIEDVISHPEELDGKLVLLGALDDNADLHKTPLGKEISGVEIHAYAVSTILNEGWMHPLTKTQNWALAIGLCFIFVLTAISIYWGYRGLVMRLIQVALLFIFVRIGYQLFITRGIIIDFACCFLMITFGLFAIDIFNGLKTIGSHTYQRFKNKNQSK